MSATTTGSTKRSPILGWAIWLFAVAFCLVALYELHRQLFWAETCVLLSAAIIMFSVTVPSRRRTWAFIIALVLVLSLWIGTIIAMLLTAVNFATRGGDQEVGPIVGAIPLISAVLGLLAVLLLVVAIVWLASVIAAEHILLFSPENGQSRWKTELDLLRSTLGRDARYGIVENGEFKPTSPKSAIAMSKAPGTIVISAGHAVVFEQPGKVCRIEGPGTVRIAPQEQCKHIVRLGPRSITFTCEGALTKDGIPLVVRGTVVRAIEEESTFRTRKENCASLEWHWYSPFEAETDRTDKAKETTNTTKNDHGGMGVRLHLGEEAAFRWIRGLIRSIASCTDRLKARFKSLAPNRRRTRGEANDARNAANPDSAGKTNGVAGSGVGNIDKASNATNPDRTGKANEDVDTARPAGVGNTNKAPNAVNPHGAGMAHEVADAAKSASTARTDDALESAKADNVGKTNDAAKTNNPKNVGKTAKASTANTVMDGAAKYHKESIFRAACLSPASGLDQALEDAAVCLVREVIATRPFDQTISHPRTEQVRPSTRTIAEEVKNALREQTAYWGVELGQFRIDRVELPETVQTEILENWKQALRGRVTSDEARAQKTFLAVLRRYEDSGSFGHMANAYIALFGTSSRIVGIMSRVMGLEGMASLNAALRGLVEKIDANEPAAKKLPEALTDLSSKL